MNRATSAPTTNRLAYYGAKITAQAGQNLLLAALFVVALSGPDKALGLSAIFLATLIPAMVFGLPAGALVDRMGAGRGYILGALLRLLATGTALTFLDAPGQAWMVAAAYSVASQVFTPGELALVPAIDGGRPGRVHSVLTVLQYAGQGLGMVVLAPILWAIGGVTLMFVGASVAFMIVTALSVFLTLRLRGTAADVKVPNRRAFAPAETIAFFRRSPAATYAVGLLGFKAVAAKTMFVAFPVYLQRDFGLGESWVALLVVPGVAGVIFGLVLAWRYARPGTACLLMRYAFLGLAGGAVAVAALDYGLSSAVDITGARRLPILEPTMDATLWVGMPAAFILGASFSAALVAGRAVLTATAPLGQQARVFAAQVWVADTVVILPLLLAGVGTELAGAKPILGGLGVIGLLAFAFMHLKFGHGRLPAAPPAAPPPPVRAAQAVAAESPLPPF